MKFGFFIINILALLFIANSCTDTEDIIPTYRFTRQIDLIATDPRYTQDNPIIVHTDSYGNTIGNAGVVIFLETSTRYYAFDLMCPHEKQISSLVYIEEDGINCICPTCESKFIIAYEGGGLLEGPSEWPLKKYNTEVRENGTLYIWN